jgi:hypothetical protein
MNSEPDMLTKKLQMLTYFCVTPQQKNSWLKEWNESTMLRGKEILEVRILGQTI